MIVVRDTDTDRTGYLRREGGYVVGGTYINPTWAIVWDKDEEDE